MRFLALGNTRLLRLTETDLPLGVIARELGRSAWTTRVRRGVTQTLQLMQENA